MEVMMSMRKLSDHVARIALVVPTELRDRLVNVSWKHRIKVSDLLRRWIRKGVSKLELKEPKSVAESTAPVREEK